MSLLSAPNCVTHVQLVRLPWVGGERQIHREPGVSLTCLAQRFRLADPETGALAGLLVVKVRLGRYGLLPLLHEASRGSACLQTLWTKHMQSLLWSCGI